VLVLLGCLLLALLVMAQLEIQLVLLAFQQLGRM
jgi:hypothetical protein